jgi:plasmid stability protein
VANLTLAIDDELLRRARIRALESGTSVNAAVRDFLVSYTGASQQEATVRTLIGLAADAGASSGEAGRRWSREAIYEERAGH